ncbi:MAG: conjugal transfer protein TraS, partial [Burkholderiales bacterium]|nr:conjugal transfer protein TraS [Burkholderiales bacterium]
TDARAVMKAAAEFARIELHGHRYVMVLHEHQANPHVHLSVRAESRSGERLYPRKADLHRWRETFAERLRGWGVEAEATRQATRGATRNFDPIWRLKARQDGRLREVGARVKTGLHFQHSRNKAIEAWAQIKLALQQSEEPDDRALAERIGRFVLDTDYGKRLVAGRPRSASTPDRTRDRASLERILTPTRRDPEIER